MMGDSLQDEWRTFLVKQVGPTATLLCPIYESIFQNTNYNFHAPHAVEFECASMQSKYILGFTNIPANICSYLVFKMSRTGKRIVCMNMGR